MNIDQHISDKELLQIVLEQETEMEQEQIESHVSSCTRCQKRLLEMAADDTWRDDFSSSLQQLPSLAASETLETGEFSPSGQAPSGDEFDLQTVDQMLNEVLQPPIHPEMRGQLGRYDVEDVIGCGGMGVVLRGFDRELHRPVAIKMILPRLARNGTAKQRFAREARAAAAVLHPNVIAIHDIVETNGLPWFVMPLIAGPSLKSVVEENGPLPEREIVRIGLQIASGLAAAHSQGLVHRDIKPENILVDNQINRVVITDFGLARRESEETMTQTGWLAGTLNYMSPEQSRGETVDSRSDLFSLGSLLFYLCAGVVPFKSDAAMRILHKIGNEQQPNVQSLNPEVSSTLAGVVNRLLEKRPEDRFQSAVELESFLNEYLAHLHQPTQKSAPVVPVLKKKRSSTSTRTFFSRIGVAVGVLALVGTTWWATQFFGTGSPTPTVLPTPELRWSAIKSRFDLDDTPEFERQLGELGKQLEEFNQHLSTPNEWPESTDFPNELQELSSALDWLDHELGTPEKNE